MPREAARRKRPNTLAKAAGPAKRLSRPNNPLEMYRRAEKHETACRNFDPHTSRLLRRSSTLERPPPQCRHGPMTNAVTVPATSSVIQCTWHPLQTDCHAATRANACGQSGNIQCNSCARHPHLQGTAVIVAHTGIRAAMPRIAGHPGPHAGDRGRKRPTKTLNPAGVGEFASRLHPRLPRAGRRFLATPMDAGWLRCVRACGNRRSKHSRVGSLQDSVARKQSGPDNSRPPQPLLAPGSPIEGMCNCHGDRKRRQLAAPTHRAPHHDGGRHRTDAANAWLVQPQPRTGRACENNPSLHELEGRCNPKKLLPHTPVEEDKKEERNPRCSPKLEGAEVTVDDGRSCFGHLGVLQICERARRSVWGAKRSSQQECAR